MGPKSQPFTSSRSSSGDSQSSTKLRALKEGNTPSPVVKNEPSLPLTFGCEFECVLVYKSPPDELESRKQGIEHAGSQRDQRLRAARIVRNVLSAKPFKVQCNKCGEKFDWRVNFFDPSVTDDTDSTAMWHVEPDGDTPASFEEKFALGKFKEYFTTAGLEIKTRKLRYENLCPKQTVAGCEHAIWCGDEIRAVIERLADRFGKLPSNGLSDLNLKDDGKQKGYLYVNKASSFHVHIGTADSPFLFPTVKYTFAALVAWERHIDRMHAYNRITGSKLPTQDREPKSNNRGELYDKGVYNLPLSLFFTHKAHDKRIRQQFPQHLYRTDLELQYNLDAWLYLVSRATGVGDLRSLFQYSPKTCVINLDNLPIPGVEGAKLNTIEFRQSIWTFDTTATLSFVDFIMKLVIFCHGKSTNDPKMDPMNLFGPGKPYRDGETFQTLKLLRKLNCDPTTTEHYSRQIEGTSTVNQRMELMMNEANKLKGVGGEIGALADLAHKNLEGQMENFSPEKIEAKINQKLLTGGYG